jgi:ABC-2 type transport system ATP-binding protein
VNTMQGQVLEIDCTQPDVAISLLRQMGTFDEVALYGALIHVVADEVVRYKPRIAQVLAEAGVQVRAMDAIAPSLEDVFISNVRNDRVGSKE